MNIITPLLQTGHLPHFKIFRTKSKSQEETKEKEDEVRESNVLEQFKHVAKMTPEFHHDQVMTLSGQLMLSGENERATSMIQNHVKMYGNNCSTCKNRLQQAKEFKAI